jgi:hypothetical protein
MKDYVRTCQCCGRQQRGLPLDCSLKAPDHWFGIPEAEREGRGKLDDDLCTIDRCDFFVRGCIELPVIGPSPAFTPADRSPSHRSARNTGHYG